MVKKTKIGIVGIQGAISEHFFSMENAIKKLNINGEIVLVRKPLQIDNIDALIIPGGESTTISNLLYKSGSLVVIIPPKIDEMTLLIFNPYMATSPSLQTSFPAQRAPNEWAQS